MENHDQRMTLTCYRDTFSHGWRHVDLFVHDAAGRELGWVHWQVPADGPDAADRATAQVEPLLRRTSEWRAQVGPSGREYWVADAEWMEQ